MILDLHHFQIAIPSGQEQAARAFYGDILGFSEIEKPEELRGRGGIWLETRNIQLHLGVEVPFSAAKKAHPGFRVKSLRQAMMHLDAHGHDYRADIDLPGIKRIYVTDPFGNRIELLEVLAN